MLVKPNLGRFLPMGFTRKGAFYYGLRAGTEDAYVATLDLATGNLLKSPAPVSQRSPGANRSPDWSPDGRRLGVRPSIDVRCFVKSEGSAKGIG